MAGTEHSPAADDPARAGEPTGPGEAFVPAPAWQRRLRDAAAFRAAQGVWVHGLHRLFEWRAQPLPLPAPIANGDRRPRCLVVAPHPDDETLGCGALMRRRVLEGAAVTVVVVTDGRHSHRSTRISPAELARHRRRESIEACALLGVHDVRFLDFEEHTLGAGAAPDTGPAAAALRAVLDDVAPHEVFLPSRRDGHPDHRALNALIRDLLDAGDAVRVYEYPIWFWDAASWTRSGTSPWRKALDVLSGPVRAARRWQVFRVECGPHRDHKRAAIAAYRSQTTNLTGEAGWATFDQRFLDNFVRFDELFFAEHDR